MNAKANARLLTYFHDRTRWRIRIDSDNGPFVLEPLPGGVPLAASMTAVKHDPPSERRYVTAGYRE